VAIVIAGVILVAAYIVLAMPAYRSPGTPYNTAAPAPQVSGAPVPVPSAPPKVPGFFRVRRTDVTRPLSAVLSW